METLLLLMLRITLFGLWLMPLAWFETAGSTLAWLVRPFARKDMERLRANVQAVYGLPPHSYFGRLFARQVFRHHMTCALETLRIIQQPEVLRLAGETELRDRITAAEAQNRGHIIVTAHLGSWELCAYLGRLAANRPFHVLAKPPRRAGATAFLNEVRERMGVDVFWTDRKSILKDMLQALKNGESVGFVMDQKPEGRKGPVVPFFGFDTEFVAGPAAMAIRTGCAVIPLFCLRTGPFSYRAVSETLAPGNHGETDDQALTERMAAAIERNIRLYPEQWTWNYKRWRTFTVST